MPKKSNETHEEEITSTQEEFTSLPEAPPTLQFRITNVAPIPVSLPLALPGKREFMTYFLDVKTSLIVEESQITEGTKTFERNGYISIITL